MDISIYYGGIRTFFIIILIICICVYSIYDKEKKDIYKNKNYCDSYEEYKQIEEKFYKINIKIIATIIVGIVASVLIYAIPESKSEKEERIAKEEQQLIENKERMIKYEVFSWCSKIENYINKFDEKWSKSFTNDNLQSIDDIQKVHDELIDYNKNFSENKEYNIPYNVSEYIQNKMLLVRREFISCLQNRITMMNYFMDYARYFEETNIQDFEILKEGKTYYDTSKVNMENAKKYLNEIKSITDN